MKRIIKALIFFIIFTAPVFAKDSYTALVNKGLKLYDKGCYTESIKEFSKAAKLEQKDKLAKLGLIVAYGKRGDKYSKENEYGKAANDYRSVLFYTLYFHPELNSDELNTNIPQMQKCLKDCETKLHFKNTLKNHYYAAKLLDIAGEYPAAAYEYMQAAKYKKDALERASQIITEIEGK